MCPLTAQGAPCNVAHPTGHIPKLSGIATCPYLLEWVKLHGALCTSVLHMHPQPGKCTRLLALGLPRLSNGASDFILQSESSTTRAAAQRHALQSRVLHNRSHIVRRNLQEGRRQAIRSRLGGQRCRTGLPQRLHRRACGVHIRAEGHSPTNRMRHDQNTFVSCTEGAFGPSGQACLGSSAPHSESL